MDQQNTNSPSPRRVQLRRADSSYENSLEQPKDLKYVVAIESIAMYKTTNMTY